MRLFKRLKKNTPPLPDFVRLPALGEEWTVLYVSTPSANVRTKPDGNGALVVSGHTGDGEAVARAMRRWLIRKARSAFVPWLAELAEVAGFHYRKVTIRGQRTRWGSYSSTGTISLNYRLLFLDPALVRYVLQHELCHTVHTDHSRKFWERLGTLEPGFRELRRAVRVGMDSVPGWAKDQD